MDAKKTAAIILAAGMGTRMNSSLAKVLHEINGRPMILPVVEAAVSAVDSRVVVVVGHQAERIREALAGYDVEFALQEEQLGTGHAVKCALPALPEDAENAVILCGDIPLLTGATISKLISHHSLGGFDITILSFIKNDPAGYGRIISNDDGRVVAIVEETDADHAEKKIRLVNSGIYCMDRKSVLERFIPRLQPNNNQRELYVTDLIEIAHAANKRVGHLECENARECMGVNSGDELSMIAHCAKKP